jgi:hypothetical protein
MVWNYFQNKDMFSMTHYLCHMIQICMLTKITVCCLSTLQLVPGTWALCAACWWKELNDQLEEAI